MSLRANWNYPNAIRFGAGRIAELPDALKAAGIARPLLVTDPGIVNLPMLKSVLDNLAGAGRPAGVFSQIQPNPIDANVELGVTQ